MFLCLFQGWNGYQGLPWFPPLPDERVRICRDPQSREFPLQDYSGLGTRTSDQSHTLPLVEIGLTDQPNIGCAMAHQAHPGTTGTTTV